MDWLNLIAIIVSVVALLVSLIQYFIERTMKRREATINAFASLQKEVFNKESYFTVDVNVLLESHKQRQGDESDNDWEQLSEYLARIEQFAVGVNTGVYAVNIIDRMAGSHIIKEFRRLYPIIKYKRNTNQAPERYVEFESMVEALSKREYQDPFKGSK